MPTRIHRSALRIGHIFGGLALGAYVYAPPLQDSAAFAGLLQFGVVPALVLSGLFMWKPRLLRRRAA